MISLVQVEEGEFNTERIKQHLHKQLRLKYGESAYSEATIGASVEFTGYVRADEHAKLKGNQRVIAIELEHYPKMTEKAMLSLVAKAEQRWPCKALALVHRVGYMEVGAPIVYVLASSSHRKEAFECAQFIMDYLKNEVPLWKKEIFTDGESWVEQKQSDKSAQTRWQ